MSTIYRAFGLAITAVICLSAGERRVEPAPADASKTRTGSAARDHVPDGQIKSKTDLKDSFNKAAVGKDGKDVKDTSKGTASGGSKRNLAEKGALTEVFNGTKKPAPAAPVKRPAPPAPAR